MSGSMDPVTNRRTAYAKRAATRWSQTNLRSVRPTYPCCQSLTLPMGGSGWMSTSRHQPEMRFHWACEGLRHDPLLRSMRNKSLDLEVAVETDGHHDCEVDALCDPAASLSASHAPALIALSVALELKESTMLTSNGTTSWHR